MHKQFLQKKAIMILLAVTFICIVPLYVNAFQSEIASFSKVNTTKTELVHSSANGLSFLIHTPDFKLQDDVVVVEGLQQRFSVPGEPMLPYFSTLIALPPGAVSQVKVDAGNPIETAVAPIQPVPHYGTEEMNLDPHALSALGFGENTADLKTSLRPDAAIYSADAFYPEAIYTLSEPMYARDVRLVELRVYPIRYNPVSHTIWQAQRIHVTVEFEGAQTEGLRPSPSHNDTQFKQLRDQVINYEQAQNWRSLPSGENTAAGISVPDDADSYKIEVNADGIYEISGAELAAQGMNIGSVNPANIEMMHNGDPVAYQFIDNNSNNVFDATDAVRFYGTAFDGSRYEKQFISNNVYWLWADGNATEINNIANNAGNGFPVVTTFMSSITKEPENTNFSTWTDEWDTFPNDADNFYWALITQDLNASPDPVVETFEIDLPNPTPGSTGNSYLLEVISKDYPLDSNTTTYTARGYINDYADFAEETWSAQEDLNIVNSVPGDELLQPGETGYPTNEVDLYLDSENTILAEIYLNRITVEYLRNLVSLEDELIFSSTNAGSHEFQVAEFGESDANQYLVWDISNQNQPVQINLQASDISGSNPYTVKIGRQHAANAQFIATTLANIKSVESIEAYTPTSVTPPSGDADWLAITYADFMSAANQLATYRSNQMSTYVVDIEDIINQSGYGFNSPTAIDNYLANAFATWETPPSYVTIFGDATTNPRQLPCLTPCGSWDSDEKTYVVTDIQYTDPFQGLTPTDFTFSLISGDDLLPDLAIGRLPAKTIAEANSMVEKIILYDSQRKSSTQNWQHNILFVADNTDSGGNFCLANENAGSYIPSSYHQEHLCLPEPTESATTTMRQEMSYWVNDVGISVLNWRGHGSVQTWASPALLAVDSTNFWLNNNKPIVILSADCLDGYFARPGFPALGETFFKYNNGRGSAAHWSAAGLGYNFQHSILVNGFYSALFDHSATAIGDAVNYSKTNYILSGQSASEAYGFILLGDPAMQTLPAEAFNIYAPIIFNKP